MGWGDPIGDIKATADAYRRQAGKRPALVMTTDQYQQALGMVPDGYDAEQEVEAHAIALGFDGVEVMTDGS